jgi:hypothetical protein
VRKPQCIDPGDYKLRLTSHDWYVTFHVKRDTSDVPRGASHADGVDRPDGRLSVSRPLLCGYAEIGVFNE